MDAGKLYSKTVTTGAAGAAIIVELRDTSGVLTECTYLEATLAEPGTSTNYVSVTPSGIYASYLDLSATGATTSGAGGIVATAVGKGVLQVLPPQAFNSVRVFGSAAVDVIVTYGNLITPNDRARGNKSQGL